MNLASIQLLVVEGPRVGSPKSAGQRIISFFADGWLTAAQSSLNSARTRVALCWVLLSAPARVGSTRCMTRCTVTDVAWFTLAHPAAAAPATAPEDAAPEDADAGDAGAEDAAWADDVADADDEAPAPAGAEAATEPHPSYSWLSPAERSSGMTISSPQASQT